MKTPSRTLKAIVMFVIVFLSHNIVRAQQSLTQINGWNAYVHLPWDYNNNSNKYPTIIFFPGLGEVGTNASLVIANGPGAYIASGWNGNVKAGTDSVKFIVISLQTPSAYPVEATMNTQIQAIKSLYRVDNNKLYLTGLSHGGWCSSTYVTGDAYGGPYTYASQVAAVVDVEGVKPDDNSPYPNLFDNFALSGGRWLGFEQSADFRDKQTVVNRMNATKPNSAIYVQTNFGGGGHCCWSSFYGGGGTQPSNFTLDGISQNIYQWMARQVRGGAVTNVAPVANAGVDKTITLPTTTATLNGSGTDADGTISSYQWTKISGPATGLLSNATSAVASLTSLIAGTYVYQLTVTDNGGLTATDQVTVTVNPLALINTVPVVNAGVDQTITLPISTATLTGSATDADGTISSYAWTKVSGPSSGTIVSPSSATTSLTGLVQGTYQFQLTATDNSGGTSTDNIQLTVNASAPVSGCGCDVTLNKGTDNGLYVVNGKNGVNIQPGQKVCIAAGMYNYISLSGIVGTAAQPITIINCGGQVVSNGSAGYGIRIVKSRYFKITGTGTAGITYGIKTQGIPPATPAGISIMDSTTDYEVDHLELQNVGLGIFTSKPPVDADPGTWSTGWTNRNLYYHDNYIHNTTGEGMYLGATSSDYDVLNAAGQTINVEPILQDNVRIYNNIVDSTGWDGIQLASSPNSSIYNNVVKNFGLTNMQMQQSGIIFGGKCTGSVYNNYINKGTGNGMQIFGTGNVKVYNNIVVDAGWDGTSTRQDGIIVDDRPQPNNKYAGLQIYLMNNTIINSGNHNIRIYNSYGTMTSTGKVINNLSVQPNPVPASDNGYVLLANGLSITNANNITAATIAAAKFVSSSDYHLLSASPAVDAGQNASAFGVTADYGGLARPMGIAYDAGAYEYNTGGVPPNQPPVANAGADKTITLPTATTTLNGSGTDADGTIASYQWTKVAGPTTGTLTNATTATATVAGLVQGIYKYELKVTDNSGATAVDTMQVTVNTAGNQAPVANAGPDKTLTLPTSTTTLDGSGTDPDGTITSYMWTKISGPATGTLTNATSATATVASLVQGTYVYQLTVTDNSGATAVDNMQVIVGNAGTNQPPVANAGTDRTIMLPVNASVISGTGSDADGTVVSYLWTQVSGPTTSVITSSTAPQAYATNLTSAGIYQFQLLVTDNLGATAIDLVQVTVIGNQSPVVNAGADKVITLPTATTTLNGSATDADGTIASYQWTKISGPTTGTLTNATSATATVASLVQGVYKYELKATDNSGGIGRDTMQVTVNATAGTNQPPVANAGADASVTLPTNTTVLYGYASTDPDGTIASYLWTKQSGPAGGSLVTPTTKNTTAYALQAGTYVYQLQVTDNAGATSTDLVIITVKAAGTKIAAPKTVAEPNPSLKIETPSPLIPGEMKFDVTAYPNPVQSNMTVKVDVDTLGQLIEMALVDLKGNTIYRKRTTASQYSNTIEVDMTRYSSGIYFLNVRTGSKMITKKVVKG